MATKKTYSVRIDDDQRKELEARAISYDMTTGAVIRQAIQDFLRQQEEKDYLEGVEARISASINRLARQVEKHRAEQQMALGVIDYLRRWLFFALPKPASKDEADAIQKLREEAFFRELPTLFASSRKAKITEQMEKLEEQGAGE